MGSRYIEIFESNVAEMLAAQGIVTPTAAPVAALAAPGTTSTKPPTYQGVVRMRGLPYSASKSDIVYFFNECSIAPEGIHVVVAFDGRATGEAYVEFESTEDSVKAMGKHRQKIGSRYIELFASTKAELMSVKGNNGAQGGGGGGGGGGGHKVYGSGVMDGTQCCLKLRG